MFVEATHIYNARVFPLRARLSELFASLAHAAGAPPGGAGAGLHDGRGGGGSAGFVAPEDAQLEVLERIEAAVRQERGATTTCVLAATAMFTPVQFARVSGAPRRAGRGRARAAGAGRGRREPCWAVVGQGRLGRPARTGTGRAGLGRGIGCAEPGGGCDTSPGARQRIRFIGGP
jgi:hypothetical protein